MARSNTLQYMILGLLIRQPMTGYDIKQIFDKEKAEFWSAPFSQIYPELNRMLKENLIILVTPDDPTSRKKTYQISSTGKTFFNDWLLLPLSNPAIPLDNDNFILRLHFIGTDQMENLKKLLALRCQALKVEISQLELELTEVVKHPDQFGHELIIRKELTNKKSDLKLWNKVQKGY